MLESREVPTATTWTNAGGDFNFDNPANWTALVVPVAGDDLYFDGSVSNARCDNMHLAIVSGGGGGDSPSLLDGSAEYHSVNLLSSYSSTVTLSTGFATAILQLQNGAISQPQTNFDITVSGSDPGASLCFNWTGGILNSSDVTSTVTIKGAGAITPANAGTVTLGSTLVFVGTQAAPKDSTINPGTIATKAAASIVVGAFSNVTARVATIGDVIGITKQQAGAQQIAIQSNGALFYIGPGTINNNLPISNAGGLFKLMDVVRVNLSGGSPVANDWDYSQTVADSRLHIENGSILTVQNKMLMSTGSLYLLMNPNLTAGEQTATITGKFVMTGGDIVFSPPIVIATQVVYGTLTVNGDVDWSGGRYIPSVDYTTAGLANEWIVNGTMTSAAACILQPNPQRGQNPPANSNWEVLIATTTAGNVPQLPQGCPLTLSVVPGTPVKWKLLS